jgi:hypothetical protein
LLELSLVVVVLALDLWWLRVLESPWVSGTVGAILVAVVVASFRRRRQLLTPASARGEDHPAWRGTLVFTLAGMAGIFLFSVLVRSEPYDEVRLYVANWPLTDQVGVLFHSLVRAALQQLLLLGFLWPVTLEVTRREPVAWVVVSVIFGAAHLPNPALAIGTLFFGAGWIWLYRRGAAVAGLLVSHVILSGAAFALLPERVLEDLHVGAKAVQRSYRYDMYRMESTQEILRRACSPDGDLSRINKASAAELIETIMGRPATEFEVGKWEHRDRYLSRCAAAKRLLMSVDRSGL